MDTDVMQYQKQILDRIAAFADGRFSEWGGLETRCGFDDIALEYGLSRSDTFVGYLGESMTDAWYCYLPETKPDCITRCWFDSGQQLILIDLKAADLKLHSKNIIELLGKPEQKLDVWHGLLVYSNGEWVYPAHGISFIISPSTRMVKHAAGFKPMTVAEYIDNVRLDLRTQRHPIR